MPAPTAPITADLSDEQKLVLAAELLAQCPPGEFADALQDISVILNDTNLLAGLQEAIEQRNANSGIVLQVILPWESSDAPVHVKETGGEGEEKTLVTEAQATKAQTIPLLLSEYNRLPDGSFGDQETGLIVRVNPFNLEVEDVTASGLRCEDSLRGEIYVALRKYLRGSLPRGQFIVHYQEESRSYAMVIVGEKFQLQNMRNGQWYSSWLWNREQEQVQGSIRLMVHYFEDGNVQLGAARQVSFAFKEPTTSTDETSIEATIAQELIHKIKELENDVQLAINEAYSQLAETTFKKLRRQLPITRAKIDWAKLSSYKVGDQLPS